jgi:hypothetical protein
VPPVVSPPPVSVGDEGNAVVVDDMMSWFELSLYLGPIETPTGILGDVMPSIFIDSDNWVYEIPCLSM